MNAMSRAVLLTLAMAVVQPQRIALELRVFDGAKDVAAESSLTVYEAGNRAEHLALFARGNLKTKTDVPPGLYDVQAIRYQDAGEVASVRWRERLVVMAYPDEGGRHLEVINFQSGFGALQVRPAQGTAAPDVALYAAGARDKETASPVSGDGYALFVVPEGAYDLLVRAPKAVWHAGIQIPADSTRMWLVQ